MTRRTRMHSKQIDDFLKKNSIELNVLSHVSPTVTAFSLQMQQITEDAAVPDRPWSPKQNIDQLFRLITVA